MRLRADELQQHPRRLPRLYPFDIGVMVSSVPSAPVIIELRTLTPRDIASAPAVLRRQERDDGLYVIREVHDVRLTPQFSGGAHTREARRMCKMKWRARAAPAIRYHGPLQLLVC